MNKWLKMHNAFLAREITRKKENKFRLIIGMNLPQLRNMKLN